MNTQQELRGANADFQSGKMGGVLLFVKYYCYYAMYNILLYIISDFVINTT
jgi:hypothetical protein